MSSDSMMMNARYGDREKLGDVWLAKRKQVAESQTLPNGAPNPQLPRLVIEEDIARFAYDMAYILSALTIMQQQVNMLHDLATRVPILEGAYSSLALSVHQPMNTSIMETMRKLHERNIELEKKLLELQK